MLHPAADPNWARPFAGLSATYRRYVLRAVLSVFSEEKKLSIAALSQTERLIEQTTP